MKEGRNCLLVFVIHEHERGHVLVKAIDRLGWASNSNLSSVRVHLVTANLWAPATLKEQMEWREWSPGRDKQERPPPNWKNKDLSFAEDTIPSVLTPWDALSPWPWKWPMAQPWLIPAAAVTARIHQDPSTWRLSCYLVCWDLSPPWICSQFPWWLLKLFIILLSDLGGEQCSLVSMTTT